MADPVPVAEARPAQPAWEPALDRAVADPALRHYFRFALASWVVGAWLLVPGDAVLAGFHALVLGFAATVALVASSQLIAAVQEARAERPGAALARFWLHAGAVVLVVAGFAFAGRLVVALGGLLFLGSLAGFLATQARALRPAAPPALRRAFHAGWGSLALAAVVGIIAALNHRFELGLPYLPIYIAHAGGGLAGLFLILILGVFYRLMPYFALAPKAVVLRAPGTLMLGGAGALLAFVTPFLGGWAPAVPFALILAAGAKYLWDTQGVFEVAKGLRWEPLWKYVAASQVWLAVALGLGLAAAFDSLGGPVEVVPGLVWRGGGAWRLGTAAAWAATAGFVLNAVAGYLHRVAPYLAAAGQAAPAADGAPSTAGATPPAADRPKRNLPDTGFWPYNGGVLLVTLGLLVPAFSRSLTAGLVFTALGATLVVAILVLAERG